MNAEQIAEGRRLEEAATKGEWRGKIRAVPLADTGDSDCCAWIVSGEAIIADFYELRARDGLEQQKANIGLTAFLRNHARELLAAAEQLEAIIGLLRLTDYSDSEILQMIREVVK